MALAVAAASEPAEPARPAAPVRPARPTNQRPATQLPAAKPQWVIGPAGGVVDAAVAGRSAEVPTPRSAAAQQWIAAQHWIAVQQWIAAQQQAAQHARAPPQPPSSPGGAAPKSAAQLPPAP